MSEMRDAMCDAADRLLGRLFDMQTLARRPGPADIDRVWPAIADAGLALAAVPEALGGAALGLGDAMALVRLTGRHAVPVPLAEAIVAAHLWGELAKAAPPSRVAFAVARAGSSIALQSEGRDISVSAAADRVALAAVGSALLLSGFADGQPVALLLSAETLANHVRSARVTNLAGEPRDTLVLDGVKLPAHAVMRGDAAPHPEHVFRLGALMRAEQLVGAMGQALDMTIRYANERVQFGRPIGKFQAVQHQIAQAAGHYAASAAACDLASASIDKADAFPVAVAAAKARASEAAGFVAATAHQVHAAIGYTNEHALQLLTKRLWSWRDEFGAETYWQTDLGRRITAAGANGGWPLLTSIG